MEINKAIEIALEKVNQIPNLHLRRLACLARLKAQRRQGLVEETVYSVDDQGNQEVDLSVMDNLMRTISWRLYPRMKSRLFLQFLRENLSCEKCNENHPACLDFHHVDQKTKTSSIAQMQGSGKSIDLIIKEIQKCIVICSNCHRKEHHNLINSIPQSI